MSRPAPTQQELNKSLIDAVKNTNIRPEQTTQKVAELVKAGADFSAPTIFANACMYMVTKHGINTQMIDLMLLKGVNIYDSAIPSQTAINSVTQEGPSLVNPAHIVFGPRDIIETFISIEEQVDALKALIENPTSTLKTRAQIFDEFVSATIPNPYNRSILKSSSQFLTQLAIGTKDKDLLDALFFHECAHIPSVAQLAGTDYKAPPKSTGKKIAIAFGAAKKQDAADKKSFDDLKEAATEYLPHYSTSPHERSKKLSALLDAHTPLSADVANIVGGYTSPDFVPKHTTAPAAPTGPAAASTGTTGGKLQGAKTTGRTTR